MWENPVFVKEIRCKFRGRLHPKILFAIGIFILLTVVWAYWETISLLNTLGPGRSAEDLWWAAFTLQSVIVWIIAPGIAANAISQEREQLTWEMLLCSPLSPREIILGKFAARSLPLLALLLVFLPFMGYSFLLSTLKPSQMIAGLGLLVAWAFFHCSAGLYASWSSRHTRVATAVAYLIALAPILGPVAVTSALSTAAATWLDSPIWWLSPLRAGQALFNLRSEAGSAEVLAFHFSVYAVLGASFLARMILGLRKASLEGQ